jgi:hypothetical protein
MELGAAMSKAKFDYICPYADHEDVWGMQLYVYSKE